MRSETEKKFIALLDKDIEANPSNVHEVGDVWAKAKELTAGVEVDLDAPLTDD